jgi:hypothetical protein
VHRCCNAHASRSLEKFIELNQLVETRGEADASLPGQQLPKK